jgi:hypothetical protein
MKEEVLDQWGLSRKKKKHAVTPMWMQFAKTTEATAETLLISLQISLF